MPMLWFESRRCSRAVPDRRCRQAEGSQSRIVAAGSDLELGEAFLLLAGFAQELAVRGVEHHVLRACAGGGAVCRERLVLLAERFECNRAIEQEIRVLRQGLERAVDDAERTGRVLLAPQKRREFQGGVG